MAQSVDGTFNASALTSSLRPFSSPKFGRGEGAGGSGEG